MNIFKRIILSFLPSPYPGDVWGSLRSPDMVFVHTVHHGIVECYEVRKVRSAELVVSSDPMYLELCEFKEKFGRRYADLEELPTRFDLSDLIHERPARRR